GAALLIVLQDLIRSARPVILDDQVDVVVRVAEADQDPAGSGVPDHVGEGLPGQDVEGLLRLAAQPERFSAHDQVRLEILGLAELADEAAHLEKQAAGGGARQRQSEDCLPTASEVWTASCPTSPRSLAKG